MTRTPQTTATNCKTMLKTAPTAIEARAVLAATKAANAEHDAVCVAAGATATGYVYDCVAAAAKQAYLAAGGKRELIVAGRGNTTHPVCRIVCGIARMR